VSVYLDASVLVAMFTDDTLAIDLPLRTPDAMHIAIAQRIGAEHLTFDNKMAAGARALGTNVLVA
jgi:predicted nucleic acid-binding protein